MESMPKVKVAGSSEQALTPEHAERFKDLVQRAATTPKTDFDKHEAERKAKRTAKKAKA